jgi:hypothetical protein
VPTQQLGYVNFSDGAADTDRQKLLSGVLQQQHIKVDI